MFLENNGSIQKEIKDSNHTNDGLVRPSSILQTDTIQEKNTLNTELDIEAKISNPTVKLTQKNGAETTAFYESITPKELGLLSIAFTIATLMIALDGSILATAIPRITSDFHRLDDVSWYGSAYLLTEMSFQPTFGRIYSCFDARKTYLVSIIIFEAGSILCAAAPTSAALIIGRALSGAGAAGLLCGSLAIFGRSVPLKKRAFGMALITSMYGVAGVVGPTLGGVITDTPRLTWRFCFWMNLPAGAVTFGIAFFTFKTRPPIHGTLPLWQKLKKLDLLGGFILTASLVSLFVALQWGGSRYAWSNPKIIGCLVSFGVLAGMFGFLQVLKKEEATIPIRILSQRSVLISCIYNVLIATGQITHGYYLPIYFQAVRGTNAAMSGVQSLPFGVTSSIAILFTGFMISSKGYYVPFMWIGSGIYIIGSVLLHTLAIHSSAAKWVGYQLVAGLGFGLTEQVPFIAVQVVLPDDDMPTACALIVFAHCLGGAVGLSIAQNIFSGALFEMLVGIQGVDIHAIQAAGLADLGAVVPIALLDVVRGAFNVSLMRTFWLPIAVSAISLLLSFGMERKVIQDEKFEDGSGTEDVQLDRLS